MSSDNLEAECCPKFDPSTWDNKEFEWKDKLFVTDNVLSLMYIPLNMGKVITRMYAKVKESEAEDKDFILLSKDVSPFKSEQYMPVTKEIEGMKSVKISGNFMTKVFEGPYKDANKWVGQMKSFVADKGKTMEEIYFYYTTCPKCAKKYGKNYVVAFAKVS